MSSEKEMQAVRARMQNRSRNLKVALICGVPTTGKEITVVTGGAAAAVVAVELLSPVPTSVLAVVGEGILALAAACGVKSVVQGRHFWKGVFMGSDVPMDKLMDMSNMSEEECVEALKEDVPVEGAMDSNLKPTVNMVAPWTVSPEDTQAFIAAHKGDK